MSLSHLPLSAIDERVLKGLIDARAGEARDIDYKRDLYGDTEEDKAEWLADVSSFANTAGGDIVIGLEAKAGIPTRFVPLNVDLDKEILRLDERARTSLQPRLQGLEFKAVPLAAGGAILVVRVARSFNPPHRIVRSGRGQNRFWARSAAGKFEPNVDELRALFTLAPQLMERIRDFRSIRLAKIVADDTPAALMDRARLIMHVVPFSAFDPANLVSLSAVEANPHLFTPIGSSSPRDWRVNFDGIVLTSNADPNAKTQRAYTQFFRSGAIEAVASSITSGDRPEGIGPRLRSIEVEGNVLSPLVRYLKALPNLGIGPPFAVMVSLVGLKRVMMNVGVKPQWYTDDDIAPLDRDQFHFGEVILDEVPQSIQAAGVAMRPFIEQLANMAGRASSSSFGPNGEYLHMFQ
jgi:hypothetical protein